MDRRRRRPRPGQRRARTPAGQSCNRGDGGRTARSDHGARKQCVPAALAVHCGARRLPVPRLLRWRTIVTGVSAPSLAVPRGTREPVARGRLSPAVFYAVVTPLLLAGAIAGVVV